jgi:hypothetical protein
VLEKIKNDSPLNEKFLIKWDDKLDEESNEEHEYRNKRMEDEDEQQFELRKKLRANKIKQLNHDARQQFYEEFIKGQGKIDQGTYR